MWPLHSWLPDAHVQAPTAGSVILAGVMLKLGTYGFLRFNLPLFPQAAVQLAPAMATLAVIGIVYGAIVSYSQKDVKKLVAYSSISHLGFVMLGLFALNAQGIEGGILQMVNHGISTGGLFLVVGMLYERRHTKDLNAFGGIWKVMPLFGGLSLIIVLSSMGLPGLNGFVGEFTILLGSMGSQVLGFFFTLFATGTAPNAYDEAHARTMAFTTRMMYQLFDVYNCRSRQTSAFVGFLENRWLLVAIAFSLATHLAVVYVPFMQTAFHTVPLSAQDWLVAAIVSSSLLFGLEIAKIFLRAHDARHPA